MAHASRAGKSPTSVMYSLLLIEPEKSVRDNALPSIVLEKRMAFPESVIRTIASLSDSVPTDCQLIVERPLLLNPLGFMGVIAKYVFS